METTRRGIEPIDYQGMVEEFMKTSGQDVYTSPREMTLDQAKLRYDLYIEELEELKAAIASNDRVEQLDALCDIAYIVAGTTLTMGLDRREHIAGSIRLFATRSSVIGNLEGIIEHLESLSVERTEEAFNLTTLAATKLGFSADTFQEAFKRVHESNMSKFYHNEDDARIHVYEHEKYDQVGAHYVKVGDLYVIKRSSDGKILKSINYRPVNLEDLV